MARVRLKEDVVAGAGNYFSAPKSHLKFIPSGCSLLDCVLGGGWALGRVANIVGDKSTGKTLLAIEACANFHRMYPKGKIWYREAEAAFDKPYAEALGMPVDKIDFTDTIEAFETVEDAFEDMGRILEKERRQPGLYILDSLDALSDRVEMQTDIDKGSYGTAKAKMMSKLFRQVIRKLEKSEIAVIIVSQERTKIGVTFGERSTRSGGRALDFYASQILWLSHLNNIKKKVKGVERSVGVHIKAKCKKNKIALPQRDCEFDIMFGYGIDDLMASLDWLREVKREADVLGKESAKTFLERCLDMPNEEYFAEVARVSEGVRGIWQEIEFGFLPSRRKY